MFEATDSFPPFAFQCFVMGSPQTQAGMRPIQVGKEGEKRTILISHGSKGSFNWRKTMTSDFAKMRPSVPLDGPLGSRLRFILPRLKTHPKTKMGRIFPDTGFDADKMERAVNDSLVKAGVIKDDSRICKTFREKRFAYLGETPGVDVAIWMLNDA